MMIDVKKILCIIDLKVKCAALFTAISRHLYLTPFTDLGAQFLGVLFESNAANVPSSIYTSLQIPTIERRNGGRFCSLGCGIFIQ